MVRCVYVCVKGMTENGNKREDEGREGKREGWARYTKLACAVKGYRMEGRRGGMGWGGDAGAGQGKKIRRDEGRWGKKEKGKVEHRQGENIGQGRA